MERFDTRSLRMVQRIMLATDGTLTDTVEAIFNEPVRLNKLSVEWKTNEEPLPWLSLAAGAEIMDRRVVIAGLPSGRAYVYAESTLALARLPQDFRAELEVSNEPLGRLWSRYRLETWKELMHVSLLTQPAISAYFQPDDSPQLVSRTYRLFCGGQPAMLINEYFPAIYGGVEQTQ